MIRFLMNFLISMPDNSQASTAHCQNHINPIALFSKSDIVTSILLSLIGGVGCRYSLDVLAFASPPEIYCLQSNDCFIKLQLVFDGFYTNNARISGF